MADEFSYQVLLSTDVDDLVTLEAVAKSRKLAENYLSIVKTIYTKNIKNTSQKVLEAAELHNSMATDDEMLDLEDKDTLNELLVGLQTIYDDGETLEETISQYIEELDTRAVTLKQQLAKSAPKPKKPKKTPAASQSGSEDSSVKISKNVKPTTPVAKKPKSTMTSVSHSGSSADESVTPSKKQQATKPKTQPVVGTKEPRKPAGSSGVQKVEVSVQNATDADKAFQLVFWNVQAPGLAKALELKETHPNMNKLQADKLIKDAKRQDLLTKYTPPEGKTFKDFQKKNRETIIALTVANNKFASCFGRYTDKARFQLRITSDAEDSLQEKYKKNPDMFVVDMAKAKNMQDLIQKRLLNYEYWSDAKGTRLPQTVVPLDFNKKYSRHVLTPEAIAWVAAESFATPPGISVTSNNKKYSNLKAYLSQVLNKPFADTFLAHGLITNGTITTLLYKTLTKQDITPEEIRKRIAAGDKTTASKFGWSAAMKSTLGTTPATWDRQLTVVDKKTVNRRVPNNSNATVFDLLQAKTKASAQALKDKRSAQALKDKRKGPKELSPFYSTNQHLWGKDITSLKEYLWDNGPATKTEHPEFFAARTDNNEEYLLSIIEESKAIEAFKKDIDYAMSEVKEGAKKKRSL